jgi:thiosulfate dehydrogenase [quinone] large subunit
MGRTASDPGTRATEPVRARIVGAPLAATAVRAWALLPLRLFLGLTFIDAGAGKLLSPAYFGSGPKSFAALAEGFAQGSPIGGPIRTVVLDHPYLFALLLAVVELAVGICALIGLASRLAAALGLALSITFFLTASWQVRPFFYGADLPFAVGWLTLLLAGHGGLPSVDAMLLRRHRSERGLGPAELVAVPLDRLQQHCAQVDERGRCPSPAEGACAGGGCLLAASQPDPAAKDASRHAFLAAAGKAVEVAAGTLVLAASAAPQIAAREQRRTADRAGFRQVGYLWQVPVGQGQLFDQPASGIAAILVRLAEDQVVAYEAICTHAKCVVGFDPDRRLIVCACHGAEFDPSRQAAVVAGPAPRPLPPRKVRVDRDGTVSIQG